MYLLAAESSISRILRGIGNALIAIPKAMWRTHPHHYNGPYHLGYAATWWVLVVIIIAALVRFIQTR